MRDKIQGSIFSVLTNYAAGSLSTVRQERQIKEIRKERKLDSGGARL